MFQKFTNKEHSIYTHLELLDQVKIIKIKLYRKITTMG